jgi:hypothetical protein
MNDLYKRAELPSEFSLEACPVCGAEAELWSFSKNFKDGPIQKVVMCSQKDAIGPRDNDLHDSCPMIMPEDDFYKGRIVDAVKFWNEYAVALRRLRASRKSPFTLYPHQQKILDTLREGPKTLGLNLEVSRPLHSSHIRDELLTAKDKSFAFTDLILCFLVQVHGKSLTSEFIAKIQKDLDELMTSLEGRGCSVYDDTQASELRTDRTLSRVEVVRTEVSTLGFRPVFKEES